MMSRKSDDERISEARVTPERHDTAEAEDLENALGALEVSEADDPTREETQALRRDVVDASVSLERKQRR
jgi:hypothetical protein